MTLLESLPFAAWFKDEHGKFTRANDNFLKIAGKDREQVIGRTAREVFDSDEARQMEEGVREVYRTGKMTESTYSRGKSIIKTVHFPVRNGKGEIVGSGGYREDITNLTAALQALHREKETLEVLLETIPFCIFFTDRHERYIRVNHMMAKLLRVSDPGEAAGKTNKEFFTKRVARKMMEEDRTIIETGTPIVNKIIYFEDDGVEGFWMEKNKIPIRDERGVITMIMGIFKDVSDLMRIENELKEARDRAEESDRLKTSFLANMSHEIRTPMNGIIGFANLLRDPELADDKKDLFLKHIDNSSGQLLNIIDDIIDISKIESGQMKISNKPVRINGVLDEIYSSYFHRIRGDAPGEKRVDFKLIKGNDSHDFTILCDDFRLRQIFNNLIGNAIKFTREGHITFGYSLRNNRHVEFFVSDSGIGIPYNKIRLIFDRFGQVEQERVLQPSGTGLGLPISKSLVNLMGGEMWAESAVGKGSTFYFTLPLVIEKPVEESRILISNKNYDWSNKLILVAEDEELNWCFVKEMLRQTGATVHRATNGREVVAQARKLSPDAILMDIKMPELSGIDAARKIRVFNKKVPIIAQSAFVMAEEKEESLQAGCNHFVTKPLDRTTIMELIDSYFK
ncbi:MAG: ATP-binding protein [Bacteroidales bacterium]|nr:ATP-binding protein [Bacteroidales bacterium]